MSDGDAQVATSRAWDSLPALLTNFERRIEKLESAGKKSLLKKLTENAGAVALFLGLVLTMHSLYDALVKKPEADRIAALTQFNAAVSSAAQIRQELATVLAQSKDPAQQIQIMSSATPRIMNAISTARAILPELRDEDVGIPQLIVLIAEAMNINDPVAGDFVKRAVAKEGAPPYLRAEAKRYEGRYLFATGNVDGGRKAMEESLRLLPINALNAPSRAYYLADWVGAEYINGDCQIVVRNLERLSELMKSAAITPMQKSQMAAAVFGTLSQYQGNHCPMPANAGLLKGFFRTS